MGKHGVSGSDGSVGTDGSEPGRRRRTDGPDALWGGGVPAPRESASDRGERRPDVLKRPADDAALRLPVRSVLAPEARAVRMPAGATSRSPRALDDGRAPARPRPPMPPVPPPVRPPAGPRTSAAPFAAVPTPERESAAVGATALDERPAAPSRSAAVPNLPPRPSSATAAPVVPRSPSLVSWDDEDHDAPWMTGRGAVRAPRVPGRGEGAPVIERRASRLPAGGVRPTTAPGESPAYGDWTKPSGSGRGAVAEPAPLPAVPAPLTTAIPDREVAGRRTTADDLDGHGYDDDGHDGRRDAGYDAGFDAGYDDGYEDDWHPDDRSADLDRRAPELAPATGSVVGGRAASRADRQAREEARLAAEAARRKEARRTGSVALDDDERPRRPRRLLTGLVAVGTVAAAILGVYTITSPEAEVAGAQSAASSSAPSSAPTSAPAVTAALPPLDTSPEPVQAAPAAPVRVPVTVLNATEITGLAADISAAISGNGKGWQTGTPGGYPNGDVAATTVYYTEGDAKQQQAAEQLKEQFPQLSGPAVRFFEVPAEVQAPGLVVVATGDWKP